jgi:outer membrane protein OmpA-like peptidoglycan-associated protein
MRNRLKTTSALIAGLSLISAGPGFPQTSDADVPMICADGSAAPCAPGVELVPAPDAAAPAEPAPKDAAPEAAPEPAPEAEAAPEPAPEPEAAPAEDAAPAASADAPAAPTEEPAPEAVPAETVTEPEPAATEAAPATESADPAPAETAPATKSADPAPAETAPATESAEPAGTGAAPQTGEAAPADAAAEAPPVLPVQPDAATGEAPVAAAASADVTAETPPDAVVSEEVVTEETARSSDEDFANSVNQSAAAAPAGARAAQKDKGLSDGEKAILLGLGAVAVGAILSNNRKVQINSGDRVVVERPDGSYQIIKDDNALLRRPGSTVRTERFDDGSSRTTVTREDGSRIVTIRDAEYRVLRRVHVARDGTQTMLFDDTVAYEPVDVTRLPTRAPVIEVSPDWDEAALRAALSGEARFDRQFSLAQIRDIERVRALVPVIDLNAVTFETGSAAIRPDQAPALSRLGELMKSYIDENPREVFLIEGHTDAVGSAAANLALSDRRAESVALAMTEYFDVPPENMVVQGYGEAFLKVPTDAAERANRRASVRRITDLLRQAAN